MQWVASYAIVVNLILETVSTFATVSFNLFVFYWSKIIRNRNSTCFVKIGEFLFYKVTFYVLCL